MRYCVTGDTLVLTNKGIMPIKNITSLATNITEELSAKEIAVSSAGGAIYVLENNSNTNGLVSGHEGDISIEILSRSSKRNTASKFFNSGKHEVIKLITKNGYKIKGTENHPLLCWISDENRPRAEWKLMSEITPEDIVILQRGSSLFTEEYFDLTPYIPTKNENRSEIEFPTILEEKLALIYS